MLKGKHSRVYLVGPFAIKFFNKGMKLNVTKEWKFLSLLKDKGIAPRPVFKIGRMVVMERINGKSVREMTSEEVKAHTLSFLGVVYLLDKMKIQKEECHRPNRHFIMTTSGVRLIDFERAKEKVNPSNVTQFLQALNIHFPGITKLGKKYKKTYDLKPIVKFIHKSLEP